MQEQYAVRATIEESGGGGAYVTVPFDVERAFGWKRVPVHATFDGEPYRGTLVRMGGPRHILIVLRELRERLACTHRREYVRWIDGAKREKTHADRLRRAVEMLAEGRKLR